LKALPQWISSGILEHVDQFGLEIHTGLNSVAKENIVTELSTLLDVFRNLYKMGFKLISSTNNDCVGKSNDLNQRYLNLFEIVFYKE
jgi:hypothetical protein